MLRPFGGVYPDEGRAQDRPFGFAQDRQAQHERKNLNVFNATSVRPEPFDLAQDRLVEACGEFIEPGKRGVFQHPVRPCTSVFARGALWRYGVYLQACFQ